MSSIKRALSEAVKHPWVEPGSLVREEIKLSIPRKDLSFAKDLAERMGWRIA